MTIMNRFLPIIIIALSAAIYYGCTDISGSEKESVYKADGIEVYPDSIIAGGKEYNALSANEITNAWKGEAVNSGLRLRSTSRMADALFAKAISETADSSSLSETDIFLSMAFIDPEKSMRQLRAIAESSQKKRTPYNSRPIDSTPWGAAAWEVYCVTGNKKWLAEAYRTICTSLKEQSVGTDILATGVPHYLTPAGDFFPSWMQTSDLLQVKSLGVNTWRYLTLKAAADMAATLGLDEESEWRHKANTLREAINDTFWEPARSRYSAYLYGDLYPILSPLSDNFAGALCTLSGIATEEMSAAGVGSAISLPAGLPITYPSPDPHGKITPEVQTLYGLAAAIVRDPAALKLAIGSLWAMSLESPAPYAWPALLVKGLLGLNFTSRGIEITPIIPAILSGPHILRGFKYREAEITISINGTGDRIASASLDDTPATSAFIPADIKGKHTLKITMSGNSLHERSLPSSAEAKMPPMPKVYWNRSREATITDDDEETVYDIYVNGVLMERSDNKRYTPDGGGTNIINIVPVTTGNPPVAGFSPRGHILADPSDIISIPSLTITPRRSPLHLIRDRETATRYIELAARHNTRLTFYVNAPAPGDYFLNIIYSNGYDETAVRTVEVNGLPAGRVICPPVRRNDWVTTQTSTTITVPLKDGYNKLSLYYVNSTILLNEIKLLKK